MTSHPSYTRHQGALLSHLRVDGGQTPLKLRGLGVTGATAGTQSGTILKWGSSSQIQQLGVKNATENTFEAF